MKNISNKKYIRLLAFLLVLTTFLPLIYQNLPKYIGSHHLYTALWFVSIILLLPDLLTSKNIRYILLYGIITLFLFSNTIWIDVDWWNKSLITTEFYTFIVAVSVLTYFKITRDFIGYAKLIKWSLIFITITAIMSIYSSYVDPLYARSMIGGQFSEDEFLYFQRLGGGGYGFAGALIMFFPMMIYFYRNNEKSIFKKWQILVFGLICFYALLRMQIVANILVAAIIIIISFAGRKSIKQSSIIASIIILIFFFIPTVYFADSIRLLSTFFNLGSVISSKLNDMANYLVWSDYYQTATGGRAARYPLLLSGFLESPIFGYYFSDASYNIGAGGHLYWMNKLSVFGIIGFILYLKIHVNYLVKITKSFDKEFLFYFSVAVIGGLGLGLIKNLPGREFWYTYFVLLPGLYYLPLLKKTKNKISTKR